MATELSDFRVGDTKIIKLFYGAGVDITGYKHWFTLRSTFDGAIVAQVESLVGSHSLDDAANGLAYLQLESDASKLIPAAKYQWDVQRSDTSVSPPVVHTLLPSLKKYKEKIEVLEGVTLADT